MTSHDVAMSLCEAIYRQLFSVVFRKRSGEPSRSFGIAFANIFSIYLLQRWDSEKTWIANTSLTWRSSLWWHFPIWNPRESETFSFFPRETCLTLNLRSIDVARSTSVREPLVPSRLTSFSMVPPFCRRRIAVRRQFLVSPCNLVCRANINTQMQCNAKWLPSREREEECLVFIAWVSPDCTSLPQPSCLHESVSLANVNDTVEPCTDWEIRLSRENIFWNNTADGYKQTQFGLFARLDPQGI